jgi:hypothetical protein
MKKFDFFLPQYTITFTNTNERCFVFQWKAGYRHFILYIPQKHIFNRDYVKLLFMRIISLIYNKLIFKVEKINYHNL